MKFDARFSSAAIMMAKCVSFPERHQESRALGRKCRTADDEERPGKHAVVTAVSYERAISRGVAPLPKNRGMTPVSPASAALPATQRCRRDVEGGHPDTPTATRYRAGKGIPTMIPRARALRFREYLEIAVSTDTSLHFSVCFAASLEVT